MTRSFIAALIFAVAVLSNARHAPAAAPSCGLPANCAPGSESAAADVVRLYYRALAARDYHTAFAQWGDNGAASGTTFAKFSRGFAQTRSTTVRIIHAEDPEGAAGSLFATIAVEVDATLNSGKRQHFVGTYTLRRVNGVPGATADQLRWHIQSAALRAASPRPASKGAQ